MVTSKIRAAYWWTKPAEQTDGQLEMLEKYGLNAALIKDGSFRVREERWNGWGTSAGKYDIALLPVLNFAGEEEIRDLQGGYRHYVDQHGHELAPTPCPLDRAYWERAIGQRFERMARLAQTTHISGVLFDTEMYGASSTIYREPCLCDICWTQFVRANTDADIPDLKPETRYEYLTQHNLLDRYASFQEDQLKQILSQITTRIQAIQPGFALGFLFYQDNWFYRGLVRGLATSRNPVLVFSESSYIRGYTPEILRERKTVNILEDNQTIVRYIPGLWLGRFFPEDMPAQLYQLAVHTDGYWLFSADSLWRDHNEGAYTLHGTHQEHWAAFKCANDELRQFAQAPTRLQSSLPPIWPSSYYDASQNRLFTPDSLKSFLYHISLDPPSVSQKTSANITYRGTSLLHALYDQNHEIQITHIPIGQYSDATQYKLFDQQGFLLAEGQLNRQQQNIRIPLSPKISGAISLLLQSGMNAARVNFSGLPFVIEASTTFPLATINTVHSYRYMVPPYQQRIVLRALTSAGESAAIRIQSPDQYIQQQIEINGSTEAYIPISRVNDSEHEKPLWMLSVLPVSLKTFEDVRFSLYNQEFPYLLPDQ